MALDTTITPELLSEGIARDFNRLVQDQRKSLGLDVSDRIEVMYSAPAHIAEAIVAHEAYLRNELLAERLDASNNVDSAARLNLAGAEVLVSVRRV